MADSAGSRGLDPDTRARLRALPSVEKLASRLDGLSQTASVTSARAVLEAHRRAIFDCGEAPPSLAALVEEAKARASAAERESLRPVLNATGVIVHTNLGRAPLAPQAQAAVSQVARGYSNLEYDLRAGQRGRRTDYADRLLAELCEAEAAFCVNNCAAAVLLACSALCEGSEVVVSRGQLVEIGGSFRLPDVIASSGASLVEVGTTNRTRLVDYERALGPQTAAIIRTHQSNFRAVGFVEEVSIEDLCVLGSQAGVTVIDDLGSGALAEVGEFADEPSVHRSVAAGSGCVLFSGDKLLGGPQAGLIVGRKAVIEELRSHPLARALRIDKLSLAALEATLRLYREPSSTLLANVPVLAMLTQEESTLARRAQLMQSTLLARGIDCEIVEARAKVGGGALPLLELDGPAISLQAAEPTAQELARRLRGALTPVIGRIRDGRLLLDPRTLTDEQALEACDSVAEVLGG